MTHHLYRPDQTKEFYTSERCHILEILNNHDRAQPLSIARARVEPGVTTAWHRLINTDEFYYILSGNGMMEIDEGTPFEVKSNDIIKIDAGLSQRIKNTDTEDLVFLAICTPPFTDQHYEELDASHPIET